jgi:hypothetical protein
MQIHVTQEDIDKGREKIDKGRENRGKTSLFVSRSCPVARASNRAFKESLKPGEFCAVSRRCIVIRDANGREKRAYEGTAEMSQWILAFDNRAENLKPVTLELTLIPSTREN